MDHTQVNLIQLLKTFELVFIIIIIIIILYYATQTAQTQYNHTQW